VVTGEARFYELIRYHNRCSYLSYHGLRTDSKVPET
jgi:hypothetical protein